jgi:hypothetical protein
LAVSFVNLQKLPTRTILHKQPAKQPKRKGVGLNKKGELIQAKGVLVKFSAVFFVHIIFLHTFATEKNGVLITDEQSII